QASMLPPAQTVSGIGPRKRVTYGGRMCCTLFGGSRFRPVCGLSGRRRGGPVAGREGLRTAAADVRRRHSRREPFFISQEETMTRSRLRRCAVFFLATAMAGGAAAALAQAPLKLPQASPAAAVTQTLGLTEIEIDYHRPAVGGRKVWGGLVPYDQVWRAGAN